MAYIHNQRDPKIEESLLKSCNCTKQKMKEAFFSCPVEDEK